MLCVMSRPARAVDVCLSSCKLCQMASYPFQIKSKMSSFKSSKNIQKKDTGPDRSVSDHQFSSVTLNELAMKARKHTVISSFSKEVI